MFLYLPLTCNGSLASVLHAPEVLENHGPSLLECSSNWAHLMFPLDQAQVMCFWQECLGSHVVPFAVQDIRKKMMSICLISGD